MAGVKAGSEKFLLFKMVRNSHNIDEENNSICSTDFKDAIGLWTIDTKTLVYSLNLFIAKPVAT